MRKQNNIENLNQLAQQIELDKAKRVQVQEVEKRYYKPHFGPEETDAKILEELKRSNMHKTLINDYLSHQMEVKSAEKTIQNHKERISDIQNIETCNKMFLVEEKLIQ